MNVTIGVCTFNRAASLRRTLDSIRALRGLDPKDTEVVVVDNNSTDETPKLLSEYRGLPLRSVIEVRQGIGAARNRLLGEAHGKLLLQTDDDAVLDPLWLEAYKAAAHAHPDAAFFAGPVQPRFEAPWPHWIAAWKQVPECFAAIDRAAAGPIDDPKIVYGLNSGVRVAAVQGHRYEDELGHIGTRVVLGEDTTFAKELLDAGLNGRWVPAARVEHCFPAARITLTHVARFYRALGEFATAGRSKKRFRRVFPCVASSVFNYAAYVAARISRRPAEQWLRHYRRAHEKWGRGRGLVGARREA
ncbi:MAG: glycosyltransferase [Planctomycetota bacterium]